jgi:cyclopropane fatty-acyl-phospholipid synthase-like methyltransferase
MNMEHTSKNHWDNVYKTKTPNEVSWTQVVPKTSLDFIHSFAVDKSAKIIDIGGGDSNLVDFLLNEGFENITVLDISKTALTKAKKRLGEKGKNIQWIVSDVTKFTPTTTYDVWHDRATFHFLTTAKEIATYLDTARKAVTGYLTIGTFSEEGPDKCSGLAIKKYNEEKLTIELQKGFSKIRCITEDHITPFDTKQHFLFCSFKKSRN